MDPVVTDRYALYHGDCIEVMGQLPEGSVDCSIYSPPFGGLYTYSSSPRDLSNALSSEDFFEHYAYVLEALTRLTAPGRMTCVHCVDIPTGNTGKGDGLMDFPGDIIRAHQAHGWTYVARYHVWNEPLRVRNRTMTKALAHQTIVEDSTKCSAANADYLLVFRSPGANAVPVEHPKGFQSYAGEREMPADARAFRGWEGRQIENKFSHWIWRQYASAFWDDVRTNRVLPYVEGRDDDDERHVHPLQLDVIERACVLWSNPGETVLTPFMGIGSEVYGAVLNGRRAVGIELKESYFRQAVRNLESIGEIQHESDQDALPFGEPQDVEA